MPADTEAPLCCTKRVHGGRLLSGSAHLLLQGRQTDATVSRCRRLALVLDTAGIVARWLSLLWGSEETPCSPHGQCVQPSAFAHLVPCYLLVLPAPDDGY